MPGSHLVCDVDRDLADVGVSMALVDTARRAPGGPCEEPEAVRCGTGCPIGILMGGGVGRENEMGGMGSGGLGCS